MKKQSKTIDLTFSLPLDVSEDLHVFIQQKDINPFVSNAIRKGLDAKKKELREAYRLANVDAGQVDIMKDWESTTADGLNLL